MEAAPMADPVPKPIHIRIAEAEIALHELMTGASVARTSFDGVSTEFRQADIPRLESYIARLKAEQSGRRTRGAIRVAFGG
jgi:hypothetical protein